MNTNQIQQHLNKIYVSTDVYEHLANSGNINKDLFTNGCTMHGVDVKLKGEMMEQLLEEVYNAK